MTYWSEFKNTKSSNVVILNSWVISSSLLDLGWVVSVPWLICLNFLTLARSIAASSLLRVVRGDLVLVSLISMTSWSSGITFTLWRVRRRQKHRGQNQRHGVGLTDSGITQVDWDNWSRGQFLIYIIKFKLILLNEFYNKL